MPRFSRHFSSGIIVVVEWLIWWKQNCGLCLLWSHLKLMILTLRWFQNEFNFLIRGHEQRPKKCERMQVWLVKKFPSQVWALLKLFSCRLERDDNLLYSHPLLERKHGVIMHPLTGCELRSFTLPLLLTVLGFARRSYYILEPTDRPSNYHNININVRSTSIDREGWIAYVPSQTY